MKKIDSVCVFCGASEKVDQKYKDYATKVGKEIAKRDMKLVYGGGNSGLMGASANGGLSENGYVIGVFPEVLIGKEPEHTGLSESIPVDTMHTRKMVMYYKADAIFILPGGFGTMDEAFEIITWKQLQVHNKPIIIHNFEGYWDEWIAMTEKFLAKGFASQKTRDMYHVVNNMDEAFEYLDNYYK